MPDQNRLAEPLEVLGEAGGEEGEFIAANINELDASPRLGERNLHTRPVADGAMMERVTDEHHVQSSCKPVGGVLHLLLGEPASLVLVYGPSNCLGGRGADGDT